MHQLVSVQPCTKKSTCMHHARYMHVLFFNDNVDDDVNDFVIDTWLLSLRNRKLACIRSFAQALTGLRNVYPSEP